MAELSPSEKFTALLRPHVEPIVKFRLKEEEKNRPLRERCRIGIIGIMLLWPKMVMKYEWIKRWMKDKDFRKNPLPFFNPKPTKAEIEELDDIYVRSTLEVIVCFWMEILVFSAENRKKFVLSGLDDAMLPKKSPAILKKESVDEFLDEACAALPVNGQDVRNVLRAVRQSLPAGQVLPDVMIEYLKAVGVVVA